MGMHSYGTETYHNSRLTLDLWNIGGCHITYKNVEHPYIQEFFAQMGAQAQRYNEKNILITGNVSLKGPDFHNFLMNYGVNLKEDPKALDTVIEVYKEVESKAILTPSYTASQATEKNQPKPETAIKNETEPKSESWTDYFSFFRK